MSRLKLPRQSKVDYINNNKEFYQGIISIDNLDKLNDEELQRVYLKVQGSVRRERLKDPYMEYYSISTSKQEYNHPVLAILSKTKENLDKIKVSNINLSIEEWMSAMSLLEDINKQIDAITSSITSKGKDKLHIIEKYLSMAQE